MKHILKWLLIAGGCIFVVIAAAALIIPKFIDIQKYKPTIEQKVAQATGRSFTLGDDMDLSVFPWVGVKLTDLHLKNPSGYGQADMVSVKNFEVRLKVIPLLSKHIEVKTFVLNSPMIYLEKLKNGTANWQGIGKSRDKKPSKKDKTEKSSSEKGLPIESLMVGDFSITNGRMIYVDGTADLKKEISDLNLKLENISLENPVGVLFDARFDGKPVSLAGTFGPIGKDPGKGTVALDFVLKALEQVEVKLSGTIVDPIASQAFDLEVSVPSFSPRKLFAALSQDFPVRTTDPKVLAAVSFKARIHGSPNHISLSSGEVQLDDSKFRFSASAKEFSRPNLGFDLQLDKIDLDRYLPPPVTGEQAKAPEPADSARAEKKKTDYGPLRKLLLDGKIRVGKLKAHGASVQDIDVHILADKGIITVDPMDLKLYQGSVASKLELNVQGKDPMSKLNLDARGIQAGPLMKDAMKKELIEGALEASLAIFMTGQTPDMIKQTLGGKGKFVFVDGAIGGIDLAGMVRNVKANFGLGEKSAEKPRTDFAELNVPFTAKNGLVNTSGAALTSPLLRVGVTGDTDLVKERLDLRVEPKFVATLKGQGDTQQRSGLTVPVLITGSFASPKIRPDLKGMIGVSGAGLDAEKLKQQVLGTKEDRKKTIDAAKDDVKKQIKGLIPGFTN